MLFKYDLPKTFQNVLPAEEVHVQRKAQSKAMIKTLPEAKQTQATDSVSLFISTAEMKTSCRDKL